MKLLIVEDEVRVADFIARGMQAEGHTTSLAADGRTGLELAMGQEFDVIILDVMLPDLSGLDVCQQLRAAGRRTPVLMLSALDRTEDKVNGLRLGADDYLSKPFSFDELVARVEALGRRGPLTLQRPSRLKFGTLEFDRERMLVTVAQQRVDLTAKELALLELLLSAPGKVFSRSSILNNVWGYMADPLTNIVDVYIHRLRAKLQPPDTERPPIVTLRGIGYRLETEVFADPAALSDRLG